MLLLTKYCIVEPACGHKLRQHSSAAAAPVAEVPSERHWPPLGGDCLTVAVYLLPDTMRSVIATKRTNPFLRLTQGLWKHGQSSADTSNDQ